MIRTFVIILTSILSMFFVKSLYGQNLVPDPSFEEYKKCPSAYTTEPSKFPLLYWEIPTKGTTDYLNECVKKRYVSVPNNLKGFQKPRSGKGYIGTISHKTWYEYAQVKLKSPLEKGKIYYGECWVSLADKSFLAAKNIGMHLGKEKLHESSYKPLYVVPQIMAIDYILDTANWVKISGQFKAEGQEQYLTLGCYANKKPFVKTGLKKGLGISKDAYYYIDDVCITEVKEGEIERSCSGAIISKNTTTEIKKEQFSPNKPIVLPDVTFASGKSELVAEIKPLLDSLANYLQNNSGYTLIIEGHTDNVGKEDTNKKLSENRAKAVLHYLVSKGISIDRVTTQGHGSQKPVSGNETEKDRATNRRVEITIVQ